MIAVSAGVLYVGWMRDLGDRPRLFNGPMVQRVTPEGFELAWQIEPDSAAEVRILDDEGHEVGVFPARRAERALLPGQTRWLASMSGLEPGRCYSYRIVARSANGDVVVTEHPVRTAATRGQPFRFLAFGDSGSGQRAQHRIARQLNTWRPDLIIHAGDLITPRALREEFPAKFFRPYAELIASTPVYPCLGNHDFRAEQGRAVLDAFILPDNGPAGQEAGRYYWFDYGDARFIAVDCNHDWPFLRDVVAPWMERVLADAADRWTIVFWHEPAYTNGDRYPPAEKLRLSLVPVIDRHRCTLVFSGHQHLYERTHPIRAGDIVPAGQGTVYVVTGAGGSNLYSEKSPRPPLIAACCDDQHSFTVVDVTGERIALRQIGQGGDLLDEYQIEKKPELITPGGG